LPLARREDLLLDRVPILSSACFSYELEILGETILAYSATNPSAIRFDVIRIAANPCVVVHGEPSNEHSWFISMNWKMISCVCGYHIGWAFFNEEGAAAFWGLIVTKLTEREFALSEMNDIIQLRDEAVRRMTLLRSENDDGGDGDDDDDNDDVNEEQQQQEEDDDDNIYEENETEEETDSDNSTQEEASERVTPDDVREEQL